LKSTFQAPESGQVGRAVLQPARRAQAALRRTVNARVLFRLLGIGLVLTICVHCLHVYQVRQNAGALRRQAQRALAGGHLALAATHLERYLTFEPGDTQALGQYGQLLDQLAEGPYGRFQVMEIFEQVLRRDPIRQDLRRRVIGIAIDQYRFRDAIQHLEVLLPTVPDADKGELEHLLGWCQDAEEHYDLAVAAYRRALQYTPGRIPCYVLLAEVLRDRLFQPEEAAKVMDGLVAANPKSSEALLARARFLQAAGNTDAAVRDMAQARALDPARVDLTLAAADLARGRGNLDEARTLLQLGLKGDKRNARLYASLAEVELLAGLPAQAVAWLRQGVVELPDAADLLILLADLLLDHNDVAEADALIARLRQFHPPPPRTDYLQARVLMKHGKWDEAAALLEAVRPRLATETTWASQVDICLGQCHEQLGEVEQQLADFRRAVRLNPGAFAARYGLGIALLATGNLENAAVELRRLTSADGAPSAAWLMLARVLVRRNQLLPEDQRDWRDAEAALDHAAAAPDVVDLTILRAEILAGRQQLGAAVELVAKARDRQPDEVRLWLALADLVGRQGETSAALDLLNQANQRPALASNPDLRVARVRSWAGRDGAAAVQELARLAREAENLAPADQPRILRELAEAFARRGDLAQAQRLWQRLAERRPRDLDSRFALFELALESGQDAAAQRILQDIRQIEGDAGFRWRCAEALRLISRADARDTQRVAAARKLLNEINQLSKDHPAVPLLEGAIDEIQRNPEQAIKHYQQAVDRGERQPRLFYQLTRLLVERRRFLEADQVVRKAETHGLLNHELARWGAEAAVGIRDQARAAQLARRAFPAPTRDYRDMLWLARLLETAGEPQEAEKTLLAAVGKATTVPDLWAALVGVLAHNRRLADAETVIAYVRNKLPADRVGLGLARCYEALGDLDRTEKQYRAVLSDNPGDFLLLGAAADFFQRTDQPLKAEPLLRQVLDPAASVPADYRARARRHLAVVLAASERDGAYAEALALIGQNLERRGATLEDKRARAIVLANKPGQRLAAVRLFESSLKGLPVSAEDQFMLAQLWESAGAWERSRGLMLDLLATNPENPQYLAFYLAGLIRHGEMAGVPFYLDRLERVEPQSARTRHLKGLATARDRS
jgi:cellulose synthase operon protein C